jgi:hypothetical protein
MIQALVLISIALVATLAITLATIMHSYSADRSRWFIERQQLQSKVDTLTEALVQFHGVPLDLNKHSRDLFKRKVEQAKNQAFKFGWRHDAPATPSQPAKE